MVYPKFEDQPLGADALTRNTHRNFRRGLGPIGPPINLSLNHKGKSNISPPRPQVTSANE